MESLILFPLYFLSPFIFYSLLHLFILLTVPRGFVLIFSTSGNYSPKIVALDMPLGMFLCYVFSVKYFIFETFTVDIGLVQKVLQNFVTIGTELKTKHLSWENTWSFSFWKYKTKNFHI